MDTNSIVAILKGERDKLDQAIAALTSSGPKHRGRPAGTATNQRRKMSPEGRARIAASARKRWAAAKKAGKRTLGG